MSNEQQTFTVEYIVKEINTYRMEVEADSAEAAIKLVEEYEVDFGMGEEVRSWEWTVSDVGIVEEPS